MTHEKGADAPAEGAMSPVLHDSSSGAPADDNAHAILSDDQRAFRASLCGLVDFYRVEQTPALWRAFWPPAFIFLPVGSVLTAVAMTDRWVYGPAQPLLILVALLVTALGPVWAIVSLLRSIRRDDRYVAIFEEGLRIRLDPTAELQRIAWGQLESVACDDSQLTLTLVEGELRIENKFAELSLPELAARIRNARRLALWGRLSRQTLVQTTGPV